MSWLVAGLLAASSIQLQSGDCPVDGPSVTRLAELELQQGPEVVLPVRLRCAGGAIELAVDDPVTGAALARELWLSDLPPGGGARYVALALVELVEAHWREPALPHASPAAAAKPAPVPPAAARLRVGLAGQLWSLPGAGLVLGGGGLWGRLRLGGPWVLGLEAFAATGGVEVKDAWLGADAMGGALFLEAELRRRRMVASLGVGARASRASLTGQPHDEAAVTGSALAGLWAGPAVCTALGVAAGRVEVSLGLEAGYAPWGLIGRRDGVHLATLGGPWLTARLGVGFGL